MPLKKEILEKWPQYAKEESHYNSLLEHIDRHNIKSKEHLRDFLKQQINLVEKWLEENQNSGSTMAKTLRNKVVELGFLKKCLKLVQEFLF